MSSAILRQALLAALLLAVLGAVRGLAAAGGAAGGDRPEGMVAIPSGSFAPLYSTAAREPGSAPPRVPVAGFLLDIYPVTNRQFLAFVRTHPRWKRSEAARIFVESDYLAQWAGDDTLSDAAPADSPVTRVSWFAAKAYCAAQGKQLPTTAQWEYAATASATAPDGDQDPAFLRTILEWYSRPNPDRLPAVGSGPRNVWGVHDLHGLVWEWTLDFNTALVTGESRGDSAMERELFCGAGTIGASNFRDYAAFMRYGYRSSLSAPYTVANLGFRCAASHS
jgi:sulfatase modifying factor 1